MINAVVLVKENYSWVNFLPEFITAISTFVLAVMAIYGVFWEWKKQIKGKTDYEIARRYLRSALKLRDAVKYVRNPFISVGEMIESLKKNGIDSEEYKDNQKTNRAVYSERWKKVLESLADLEAEVLEAEVSWGRSAVIAQDPLNKLIRELSTILRQFLDGYSKEDKEGNELIYDIGKNDEFNKKVNLAVEEIESFLKPYLK